MVMDRNLNGTTIKRLRVQSGVGLAEPLHLSPDEFASLDVWTPIN
jgi:hypothetical protein